MANQTTDNLRLENVRIIFRNFSGKEGRFNRAGDRNFCVVIDTDEQAQALLEAGWNVHIRPPRDEDEEPLRYIPVAVRFGNIPPRVYLLTRKSKVALTEETIGTLDNAEIRSVDLTLRPYHWEVNGNSGIKAYLKVMYVTVEEDDFADKYDHWGEDISQSQEEEDDLPF